LGMPGAVTALGHVARVRRIGRDAAFVVRRESVAAPT